MKTIIAILSLFILTACGNGNTPFDIRKTFYEVSYAPAVPVITLTAKEDLVKITRIKINRGGCALDRGKYSTPVELRFGENHSYFAVACDIKEVEVVTPDKTYTFTF